MKRRKRSEQEIAEKRMKDKETEVAAWVPITLIGKAVKNGEIDSLDTLFEKNIKIKEPLIVDYLVSDLDEKQVDFKKTTKVRRAGRKFAFRASVLVGDKNKYIGLGTASDTEKWPAIKKATQKAKLKLKKVIRGCGSWECTCSGKHSVPFRVSGRSSSVRITLFPAPKGTGLAVGDNIKDVLRFAGIKDAWSKTKGNTGSKLDFVSATIDALSNTATIKLSDKIKEKLAGDS